MHTHVYFKGRLENIQYLKSSAVGSRITRPKPDWSCGASINSMLRPRGRRFFGRLVVDPTTAASWSSFHYGANVFKYLGIPSCYRSLRLSETRMVISIILSKTKNRGKIVHALDWLLFLTIFNWWQHISH